MITDKEKHRIAQKWANAQAVANRSIGSFRPTQDYLLQCLSGDPNAEADCPEWLERWLVQTFLADRIPVDECLTLCCTSGVRERNLAVLGAFKHCTGMDISAGAIEKARVNARQAGYDHIDYAVMDLDHVELEPEKYDVVFALGALHHISRLEHLLAEVHKALKPGGVLIDHDYIGPSYNNLSFRHREVINAAMHLIPGRLRRTTEQTFCPPGIRFPRWRRAVYEAWRLLTFRPSTIDFVEHPVNPRWPGPVRWLYGAAMRLSGLYGRTEPRRFRFGKVFDVSPAALRRADASETVRSSEIIPVIKSVFGDVTVRYGGMSIMHFALDYGFFRNYRDGSPEDRAVLDMLIGIEKVLTQLGEIPPILATCVARK